MLRASPADVMGVPTMVMCRTMRNRPGLITSDIDERDRPSSSPTAARRRVFYRLKEGTGVDHCIARGLAFAETGGHPVVGDVAAGISTRRAASPRRSTRKYPGKLLAYNCSPSFNWRKNLDPDTIEQFQRELRSDGLQVPSSSRWRVPLRSTCRCFELARGYRDRGHGRLFRDAAGGIRCRGERLSRHPPPARKSAPAISTRSRMTITGGRSPRPRAMGALHRDGPVRQGRAETATQPSEHSGRVGDEPPPAIRNNPQGDTIMPNVKERAEDLATTMDVQQQAAIRMLANQLHLLNGSRRGGREFRPLHRIAACLSPSPPGRLLGRFADADHRQAEVRSRRRRYHRDPAGRRPAAGDP